MLSNTFDNTSSDKTVGAGSARPCKKTPQTATPSGVPPKALRHSFGELKLPSSQALLRYRNAPLKQGDNSNAIDEFCCEWSREAPRLWCRVGHKSQNESINKQSKNDHKTGGQYISRHWAGRPRRSSLIVFDNTRCSHPAGHD